MTITTLTEPDEIRLLVYFRGLSDEQQAALLVLLLLAIERREAADG